MMESLKSILAHIQCNEDACVSDHEVLSGDDPGKSDFDQDQIIYFLSFKMTSLFTEFQDRIY
jgi:hypothetical protein